MIRTDTPRDTIFDLENVVVCLDRAITLITVLFGELEDAMTKKGIEEGTSARMEALLSSVWDLLKIQHADLDAAFDTLMDHYVRKEKKVPA